MYVKIHTPQAHSANKGSSKDLIDYLEKENAGIEATDQEYFFSHHDDRVSPFKVQDILDHNNKGLKANDSKFFMLTVNPSQDELAHIANDPAKLKDYTRDVMDQYAKDMNRMVNDRPLTGDDLVYFAKLEKNRIYKQEDRTPLKEVFKAAANGELKKQNFSTEKSFSGNTTQDAFKHNSEIRKQITALKVNESIPQNQRDKQIDKLSRGYLRNSEGRVILPGNKRDGLQTHVHVIVSRKDQSQSVSMSPLANSRGSKNKLNGKEVKIGFHREKFVDKAETIFDKKFGYERTLENSFQFKHGKIHDPEKYAKAVLNQPLNAEAVAKQVLSKAMQDPITQKLLYAPKTPKEVVQKLEKQAIKAIATAIKANPAGLPVQVLEKTLGAVGKGIAKSGGLGM